ncbi:MAG: hypothetical protein AB7G80_08975 [Dongiaceae bacterium]
MSQNDSSKDTPAEIAKGLASHAKQELRKPAVTGAFVLGMAAGGPVGGAVLAIGTYLLLNLKGKGSQNR